MFKQDERNNYAHGGDVWSYAYDVLDFSANINNQGLSKQARQAMVEQIDQVIHYPDPHCRQLLGSLSNYLDIPSSAILCGNGAVDLLDHWVRYWQLQKVLLCEPAFGQYHRAIRAQGAQLHSYYLDESRGFIFSVEQWLKELEQSGCDGAILCSPHNPLGWTFSRDTLNQVIQACEARKIHLLIDESFIDFLPVQEANSAVTHAVKSNYVGVLYSLTKFFSIPGLRLGTLIAEPSIIEQLKSHRDPWSVNHLAQVSAVAALQDREYQEKTKALLPEQRGYLQEALLSLPSFEPLPSAVNFMLVNIEKSGYSSTWWTEKLAQRNILVRNCNSFALLGERYLRIAVRKKEETEILLGAFESISKEET
ncbi:aminotransferase class I/II-fold pyridoxal phosphate-dependent enzyme [Heliorestis acidaminivorans]|uniref:Aminotransferase n=1 Tax=Heliorestis acidaminivorans TaxID=553427 RepID=A0A6I0EUZ9_9FIRM|nr:threonine-phosphate decarboxylase [Heliorestis acidaminivorans]KAB2954194.1 aminotransferase class I/II-fold pyridoxal phosphate-dependent enzyme [Heliorestis acidaminivorans]